MEEKEFDYINVIPFIDIMLVLLTIVLTTSTFIAQGAVPIQLPRVSGHQPATLKSILVEIDRQCVIYLNTKPVSLAALGDDIRTFGRETPVVIRADRTIALQAFVDVLDVVKARGFSRLSLQTEKKE